MPKRCRTSAPRIVESARQSLYPISACLGNPHRVALRSRAQHQSIPAEAPKCSSATRRSPVDAPCHAPTTPKIRSSLQGASRPEPKEFPDRHQETGRRAHLTSTFADLDRPDLPGFQAILQVGSSFVTPMQLRGCCETSETPDMSDMLPDRPLENGKSRAKERARETAPHRMSCPPRLRCGRAYSRTGGGCLSIFHLSRSRSRSCTSFGFRPFVLFIIMPTSDPKAACLPAL